jgi:hypothetical protein
MAPRNRKAIAYDIDYYRIAWRDEPVSAISVAPGATQSEQTSGAIV